ncbi:MAG: hypothetical protein ACRDFB_07595, partial [Rhabdochlamydiaceae bacterium]
LFKNNGTQLTDLRGTIIRFSLKNGECVLYETDSTSICIPPDQFCKRTGRRLAGIKLLKNLKNNPYTYGFSKTERREIFNLICPEFFKGKQKLTND